jgi:hypothetical protein
MRFVRAGGISLVVLAGLIQPPPAARAQSTPTRTFTKPVAEFEEPFTSVGSVRELSNGRVIVSDSRDRVVQLLDFGSGEAVQVGREGQGPGEYSFPGGVYAAPGDTTLLYDPLSQRLLLIAPNGKPAGQHSLRREGSGPGPSLLGQLRGTDSRGRLYSQASGIRVGAGGPPESSDSVPIVRYDRGSQKADTVTFIMQAKSNTQVSGGQGNMRVVVGAANPLAPRDEWAVAPDGRVAVVTPEPYRVRWIAPNGAKTTGPVINVPKVKVSDADKAAIEKQRASGGAVMMTRSEGPGGASAQARTLAASALPPLTDWPEHKPPFVGGAATVAPNGELWVRRTLAGDPQQMYDVFDAKGQRVAQVQLPKGTRLAGFGKGSAYLIRLDADDLQYIQKYSM